MRARSTAAWLLLAALPLVGPVLRADVSGLPADLSNDAEARGFADLLFTHGSLAARDGNWNAALGMFGRAAATRPEDPTYAYFVALAHLRLGQLDEAIAGLEAVLATSGSRVPRGRMQHDLGEAFYRKGDLVRAEAAFRAALRGDLRDGVAHFHLGMTLLDLGREDEAFTEFERAAAVDPELGAKSAYYLGIQAAREGNTEEARRRLARAAAGARDARLEESGHAWLDLLDVPAEKFDVPRAELRLGLAAVTDDNPAQIHEQFPLKPPGYGSDSRGEARFRAALHPVIDRRGWTLGLVGQGAGAYHRDFETGDLQGVQGTFQAAWGSDPLGFFDGPLGYARVPVSGEHRLGLLFQTGVSYFDRHRNPTRRDFEGSLSVLAQQGRFGKTQFDVHYRDQDFLEALYEPFDGGALTARLMQTFRLGRPDRSLRVFGALSDIAADVRGLEREVIRGGVEVTLPAGKRVTFFVGWAQAAVDWDDDSAALFFPFPLFPPPPIAPAPREDTIEEARASMAVVVSRHIYVTLGYGRTERDIEPAYLQTFYGFERNTGSVGATVHW